MPRLTEVKKLATSDSYGGRAKGAQKRKYILPSEHSPGRTRSQTKKINLASSALLQIGNLHAGNQPGGSAPAKSSAFPLVGNLNGGSQPPSDEKMFVSLPAEWRANNNAKTPNNLEGNRIVDVKQLQHVVKNNFCCRSCIPKAVKTYLESFFNYADQQMREMKYEVKKLNDASEKIQLYEREMISIRDLYRQFTGQQGGKNNKSKREEKLSVGVEISNIKTTGLASEITFQCSCRDHFNNSQLRPHVATIIPTHVKNEKCGTHASYLINHNAVCAFHHMGSGPYHMQQLAAWLDHPWRMIPKCFKKTEKKLGEKKEIVCKKSKEYAIMLKKKKQSKIVTNLLMTRNQDWGW